MGMENHPRRRAASAGIPADGFRAAATVAIVFWLVGLGLAIATNSLSGSSALLGTIKSRLFSPLLVPAWLDLGFDYRLTSGLPDDADHDIDITQHDSSAAEPLAFPGSRRGEQAARWRRLARAIAVGGVEGDGSVVAAGVGRGSFDAAAAADVNVRVYRRPQPERTGPADPGAAERVYAARVRMVDGDVQLIKEEARGELAPLVTPIVTPQAPRGAGEAP